MVFATCLRGGMARRRRWFYQGKGLKAWKKQIGLGTISRRVHQVSWGSYTPLRARARMPEEREVKFLSCCISIFQKSWPFIINPPPLLPHSLPSNIHFSILLGLKLLCDNMAASSLFLSFRNYHPGLSTSPSFPFNSILVKYLAQFSFFGLNSRAASINNVIRPSFRLYFFVFCDSPKHESVLELFNSQRESM